MIDHALRCHHDSARSDTTGAISPDEICIYGIIANRTTRNLLTKKAYIMNVSTKKSYDAAKLDFEATYEEKEVIKQVLDNGLYKATKWYYEKHPELGLKGSKDYVESIIEKYDLPTETASKTSKGGCATTILVVIISSLLFTLSAFDLF